jgi:hypothetical protein
MLLFFWNLLIFLKTINIMKKIIFSIIAIAMMSANTFAQTVSKPKFSPVKSIEKTDTGVKAEYKDGSTAEFTKTTTSQVSLEDQLAVINGEKRAYLPEYRQVDGLMKHHVFVTLGGGCVVTTKGDFHPVATGRLGYEICHFIFSLAGQYSQAKYTGVSEVQGKYDVFNAVGDASWKFLQNSTRRNYLAVGGEAGYGFQRTDGKGATAESNNYGLILGGFLEGRLAINHQFGVVCRGGYRVLPYVEHYGNGQDLKHGGAYLEVGLNIKFRQKPYKK